MEQNPNPNPKPNNMMWAVSGLVVAAIAVGVISGNSSDPSSELTVSQAGITTNGSADDIKVDDIKADEMRLELFDGNISLMNLGSEKFPVAGSRLMSQDYLTTFVNSSAYILLDMAKTLRMLEISQLEVQQEKNHYTVELFEGSLFFCVSEALGDDESLNFHTNNVITGVRGTSGVITYNSTDRTTQIAIFSGSVSSLVDGEEVIISAGEVGVVITGEDGDISFILLELRDEEHPYFFPDDFVINPRRLGFITRFKLHPSLRVHQK